jgi:ribosomal-protein-alanine N-acetyltransferase
MPYAIRPAREEDVPQLTEIEREAFPTNWPPAPFKRDLSNRMASVLVAYDPSAEAAPLSEADPESPVAGNTSNPGGLRGILGRLFGRGKPASAPLPGRDQLAGYVATWFMTDEAHITGIAVREALRGNGVGELLLLASVELALDRGSRVVTLEVRVSNHVAQSMYTKYGFKEVGLRKRYYTDNNEDAYIMTTDAIASDAYSKRFRVLVETYKARRGDLALVLR